MDDNDVGGLNLLLIISMHDTVFAIDTSIIHYIMFMLVCYIYWIFFQQKSHVKLLICEYYYLNIDFGQNVFTPTRMHSSRMHTSHSFTICRGCFPWGCTWSWGLYLVPGVCTWSWGLCKVLWAVYLVLGGVPGPRMRGVCHPGVCTWSQLGVWSWGRVGSGGGVCFWGAVCFWGVSVSQHALSHTPSWA